MLHVALLRAINVGGRRVTNDELRSVAVGAGFTDVTAYQASGNLIVEASHRSTEQTAIDLEAALADALGFTVEVMVRDTAGIDRALSSPFTAAQVEGSTAAPQVVFLRHTAGPDAPAAVEALNTPQNVLVLAEDVLHWLPVDGVGRSALDMGALTAALGPLTARGRPTLARIRARFLVEGPQGPGG